MSLESDKQRMRVHPVEPFKPLKLARSDGTVVVVSAFGLLMRYPAIDVKSEKLRLSGRMESHSVAFSTDEFPALLQYIQEAADHWKE